MKRSASLPAVSNARKTGATAASAPEREENASSQCLVLGGLQQIVERRDHPSVREIAQRIDCMVAHQRVGRARERGQVARTHERGQDDAQGLSRAEAAQRLDAVRADRRGALFHQAARKSGQSLRRTEAAQRLVDRLSDPAVRLRQREPIEQRPDRLRLAPETERMRGLLANVGALERERLDQGLERDGAVLPAVGRGRAGRQRQQDHGEGEDDPDAVALSDHGFRRAIARARGAVAVSRAPPRPAS